MLPQDPRVERVIDLMEQNRFEPLRLDELARAVNLSTSHLTRLFKTAVGRPPGRYDRERRLDAARLLVANSFLSIKEVMAAVGWTDPSHFCRDFTSRFGESPARMRARCHAEMAHEAEEAIPPTDRGFGPRVTEQKLPASDYR